MKQLLSLVTFLMLSFGSTTQALPIYEVSQKKTISVLSKKIKSHKGKEEKKAWLQWQLALAAAEQDKNDLARNQILRLLEDPKPPIDANRLYLLMGRIAYQQKEFSEAVDWYKKVKKSSDFWLEAKEEMAWSYLRMSKPNLTIEALTTVTSPVFSQIVGPEPYFLHSYANLMICDYPKVFEISKTFKSRNTSRIQALEQLAAKGTSKSLSSAIEKLKTKPFATASVAPELASLPRLFYRDEFFRRHMENKSWTEAKLRVQQLARIELQEYKLMIQKIHLVEAEVIQRIHLAESRLGKRKTLKKPLAKSSDTLTFPITKEVWLDELDSYHAEVKDCPKLERAAL